jgi:hypothetical protein
VLVRPPWPKRRRRPLCVTRSPCPKPVRADG